MIKFQQSPPLKEYRRHWQMYIMVLFPVAWFLIFRYWPMYGAQIAFRNFEAPRGITGSEWVGLKYFIEFFSSSKGISIILNTLLLNVYTMILGFPAPIILAICLNEIKSVIFKKTVQMITYAPYFISTIVMVSILFQVLDPRIGIINLIINALGGTTINFVGESSYFRIIYAISHVWQVSGYWAVLYLAALSSISPELHEAAIVDGATKLKRIWYVDLPGIAPTITIMLLLNLGQLMNVGFEKVFLMQNPLNISVSEVIQTYVYRMGVISNNYSLSAAIGLFNSVINLILIVTANGLSKKAGQESIW